MIKTYKIIGTVEKSIAFKVGQSVIRCNFIGGSVNESSIIPAIFSTNNPVIQTLIETSIDFRNGYINVESEIPEKTDNVKIESNVEITNSCTSGEVDYPDVTTGQMAREVMNKNHGISLSKLTNNADIIKEANLLGVTFSNWQLK